MQAGEILRRAAFNGLDRLHGGKLAKIKAVNKREIVEGITEEYEQRRVRYRVICSSGWCKPENG